MELNWCSYNFLLTQFLESDARNSSLFTELSLWMIIREEEFQYLRDKQGLGIIILAFIIHDRGMKSTFPEMNDELHTICNSIKQMNLIDY